MNGMLDAVYEKEWMENYLRVTVERTEDSEYEEKMLSYNDIPGFLKFDPYVFDVRDTYRYKVTGRKPLSAVFQALPIREWHLRKILTCLIETIERGREYLICDNDLVLDPEDVFVNIGDYSVDLMCLPGFGRDFRESMDGLLEFMLNRVDYDDKKAVELVYDCYVIALKEENGLKALKERLGKKAESTNAEEERPENIVSKTSVSMNEEEKRPVRTRPVKQQVFWDDDEDVYESEETSGFMKWLKGLFTRHDPDRVPAVAEERNEFPEPHADHFADVRPVREETENRTVFLSQRKIGATPYLLSIATGEMIRLSRSPFCIGSMREHMDHTLLSDGVSRLHAKLYSSDGAWFVSDLNSTNGTFVNERNVLPGSDTVLYNNDKIRFAGEEYVFKSGSV